MIALYYIATAEYTKFFESYLQSVQKWMPNEDKTICLLADSALAQYDGYHANHVSVQYHHINHFPWPTITTWKFWLMQEYKVTGAWMHFFFNADIIFTDVCMTFDYHVFSLNKIVVSQHSEYNKDDFSYIQAGCIAIPESLFDNFTYEHSRIMLENLNREHSVPTWHDETILNYMLIDTHMFPFVFFDVENMRWHYTSTSKPSLGLCMINPSQNVKQKNSCCVGIKVCSTRELSWQRAFQLQRWFEWQTLMDVSDEWSVVQTSKCACTSMAWLCAQYNHARHSQNPHGDAARFKYHGTKRKKLFAIYRDPIERFLSFYTNKVQDEHHYLYLASTPSDNMFSHSRVSVPYVTTLPELLHAVEHDLTTNSPFYQDQHARRQVDTYPLDKVDVIVPVQHLNAFLAENGIPIPPRINISHSVPPTLSDEQIEKLKKLYAEDFLIMQSPKLYSPSLSFTMST